MRTGLTTLLRPGVCRECGCTMLTPCAEPVDEAGETQPCEWIDDEETRCSACALIFARSLGYVWQEARTPMITGAMPIEEAVALVASEAEAGHLVRVCSRCQHFKLRTTLSLHGFPNVSHGYCPPCLEAELAAIDLLEKGAAA